MMKEMRVGESEKEKDRVEGEREKAQSRIIGGKEVVISSLS